MKIKLKFNRFLELMLIKDYRSKICCEKISNKIWDFPLTGDILRT